MAEQYSIWIQDESKSGDGLLLKGNIDLVEDLDGSFKSRITSIPVEDGSVIADNVYDDPTVIKIKAIVTNTTSGGANAIQNQYEVNEATSLILGSFQSAQTLSEDELNQVRSIRRDAINQDNRIQSKRPSNALAELIELKNKRTFLRIDSLLRSYSNMLIESISYKENYGTGSALLVTIQLKEVIIAKRVETNVYIIPSDQILTERDLGAELPTPVDINDPLDEVNTIHSCTTGRDPVRARTSTFEDYIPPQLLGN